MSSFENLLEKYIYFTVHTGNLQILGTEIFKTFQNISRLILEIKEIYGMTCVCLPNFQFQTSEVCTVAPNVYHI